MDIDIYSLIGLTLPIAGLLYAIVQRPRPAAWFMIVPSILFLFVGAVSNSGVAPIAGHWANASNGRYLFGSLITLGGAILLVISCWTNPSNKSDADDA